MTRILFMKAEPTAAQMEAGNYAKRKIPWRGMVISIENEAGSMRRGKSRDGKEWSVKMKHAYGYLRGTEGVDGDHVDCFIGPNMDADMVYVVHARTYGDWEKFDEDKCMIGFDSEADAKAAFLASYSDKRFLGPITSMPVDKFIEKARGTKNKPAMIKALLFTQPGGRGS